MNKALLTNHALSCTNPTRRIISPISILLIAPGKGCLMMLFTIGAHSDEVLSIVTICIITFA